jgi:DNA-binding NtrC family response regulator
MASASSTKTQARILIVDDNNMGLLARRSVLEELGHLVITSSSPHDALELCSKQHFDIVITDFKMPKMNGVDLIAKLRKLDAHTAVILISGFTDAMGLNEQTTGADVVLQKSSNEVNALLRAVSRLLRKPAPKKKPPTSQAAPKKETKKSV